jgi:hypothetical protein
MARSHILQGARWTLPWIALVSSPACATGVALNGHGETCANGCNDANVLDSSASQNDVQSAPDAGFAGDTVNGTSSSSGSSADNDANDNPQDDAGGPDATTLADSAPAVEAGGTDATTLADSAPAVEAGGTDATTLADSAPTPDGPPSVDAPYDAMQDGSPIAPVGLLYYFPLAADTNDYSGNGHNATNMGASHATGHSGEPNTAYSFNGTSSYLVAPGTALPVGSAARTLAFWTNPSSPRIQFGITSWGNGDCIGKMFGLGSGQKPFWAACDDAGDLNGIPMGSWTFLAAVFTPPTKLRLFVNGNGVTYTLPANLNTNPSSLYIGADSINNPTIRSYFAGSIDSIRIYGRALTDAEVATVMVLP